MDGNPRKFASVKLEKSVIDRARVIAAWRQVSLGDYLSDLASQCIERDSAEMIAEMSRRAEPGKKENRGGGRKGNDRKGGGAEPPPGSPDDAGPVASFDEGNPGMHRVSRPEKKGRSTNGDGIAREI